MITAFSTLFFSVIAVSLVVGAAYRFLLRPVVCYHFGEESRRDFDAARRRREFERRCMQSLTSGFFSGLCGMARGMAQVVLPDLANWALAAEGFFFLLVIFFAWIATLRWREQFEN